MLTDDEIMTMARHAPACRTADEEWLAFGRAIEAEAYERAAEVCEQSDDDGEGPDCWGWHAKDYAKHIRALGGPAR